MLNHIPRRIPPIVEKLASQDMPPHAPDALIPFLRQPLVPQALRVEVVHFERTMVYMRCGIRRQEDSVVIRIPLAQIDMRENRHILLPPILRIHRQKIRRHDIKRPRIPLHLRLEIPHTKPIMPQLMHRRGARLEPLKPRHSRLFRLVVGRQDLRVRAGFLLHLPMDQINGKSLGVVQCNHLTPARRVAQILDRTRASYFCGSLQLAQTRYFKRAAQELGRARLRVVHVLVVAVALEPPLSLGLARNAHAEVAQERGDFVEVGVLVAHVH